MIREIKRIIGKEKKILDLGCGQGNLMHKLKKRKNIVHGIDIDEKSIIKALNKGLSVIQYNLDKGLLNYNDNSYDFVILKDTLQTVHRPAQVLKEATRVGKKVIVVFPNFAYYRIRLNFILKGIMPKSKILPYEWYDTPNIHLFTIKDFENLCKRNKFKIKKKIFHGSRKKRRFFPNFFSKDALYILKK